MKIILLGLAGVLLQWAAAAGAVPVALTNEGGVADFADYRIDAAGNIHLVWFNESVDNGAIFYKMVDADGTDLIPALQVNSGGSGMANSWPAIERDAGGLLYVVWQDVADGEVWMLRLNPANAPQDGSPTTTMDIRDYEVRLSTDGGTNAVHPRIRIDANGELHVVWESTNGGGVEYAKVNPLDGTLLNGPVDLGAPLSNTADLPEIDVDTNGHAHIVFGSGGTNDEVYYAMVDGDPLAVPVVRISPTVISEDDGMRAGSATVNVDFLDNTLYIVYAQALAGGEEVFMARIDPSRDAQDGGSADPAVIKLSEQQITDGEGVFQWFITSRIGGDTRIHATYIDFDTTNCTAPYAITDAHITFSGTVITRQALTSTGSATSCIPRARIAPGSNRIVWPDSTMAGITEILSETFSRVETGESGFTCSLSNRDGEPWRSGELWLLLGFVLLLGGRNYRRRR